MKYTAEIGGSSWNQGPKAAFDTITDARQWAESYGTTADWCRITDRSGRVAAQHRRSTEGDGRKWYKSAPGGR